MHLNITDKVVLLIAKQIELTVLSINFTYLSF